MVPEQSVSLWMDLVPAVEFPKLTQDGGADVVVVGAGIAGLSVAYEAARLGKSVVVIDRARPGRGMTCRTTAHLATELDDYYCDLISLHGEEQARNYYQSQAAAIDRIEAIVQECAIACDFNRLDGYRFAAGSAGYAKLEQEYKACCGIGVENVQWTELPEHCGGTGCRAIRFPRQARFHPLKYLAGLMQAIQGLGGQIYGETPYTGHRHSGGGLVIETEGGPVIRSSAAVFATNAPVNNMVAIHSKQIPFRTYVIAGRVPKQSVADVLLWDTADPYHYVRIQPFDESYDMLIAGGEDHRSGSEHGLVDRLERLQDWTHRHFPQFAAVDYRWSGQVMEPIDYLPFTGRNPGEENVYIHSGDSGQGMTNGALAGLVIAPLLTGQHSRFAETVRPDRIPLRAIGKFTEGLTGTVQSLGRKLWPGERASSGQLEAGQGAVVTSGLHKIAAYRDNDGRLYERSASCSHLGCVVQWNDFEKCWDCGCHGSQFQVDGTVLSAPTLSPLAPAQRS